MTAARALIANGWEVAEPIVPELYDLVAKDPANGRWSTIQVKTIRRRSDRNNEMVIYATNGKGLPYQPQDCDYMIGIEGDTVYMTECTGIKEYWATDVAAAKRWVKFTTDEMVEPTGNQNNEKAAI
jgi:hypothetical protein